MKRVRSVSLIEKLPNDVNVIVYKELFDDQFSEVTKQLLDVTWDLTQMDYYDNGGNSGINNRVNISRCYKCKKNWCTGHYYSASPYTCDNCITLYVR